MTNFPPAPKDYQLRFIYNVGWIRVPVYPTVSGSNRTYPDYHRYTYLGQLGDNKSK